MRKPETTGNIGGIQAIDAWYFGNFEYSLQFAKEMEDTERCPI